MVWPISQRNVDAEDTVPYDAEEAAWQGWQAGEFRDASKLSFLFHTKRGWVKYGIVSWIQMIAGHV